jgi:hypothetical protein
MTKTTTFNYGIFATLPTTSFTIVELLAANGIEKTRINQIKSQRKLNAMEAKGLVTKEKVGLENKFFAVAEDTNVKGAAFTTTPADELNFELPVVEFGSPATITVGTTQHGDTVSITKTRKYQSNKTCGYTVQHTGNAYQAAFTTASAAINAAKACFGIA